MVSYQHKLFSVSLISVLFLCACQTNASLKDKIAATDDGQASAIYALDQDLSRLSDPEPLIDLGLQYNDLGRHDRATQAFRRALFLQESAWGQDDPRLARLLTLIGTAASSQGQYAEAELAFQRAENLALKSPEPLDRPRLITARAAHLAQKGDLEGAWATIQTAKSMRRNLLQISAEQARGSGVDPLSATADNLADMANGLFIEAVIAHRLELYDEAKLAANLARRIVDSTDLAPDWWLAPIDEILALIEIKEDGLDAAEKRLKQALITKRWALGETRPAAQTLLLLGQIYAQQGRSDESVTAMRQGLEIIRAEKPDMQGITTDELLAFLTVADSERRRLPAQANPLAREMFEVSQLGREGTTAQTIARTAARLSAGDQAISDLIRQVQIATQKRDSLRLELGRESALPAATRQEGRLEALKESFITAREQADRLETDLHARFPTYRQLVASQPVAVTDITTLLRPEEALIQIIIGKHTGFLFLLRPTSEGRPEALSIHPLALNRQELNDKVRELRRAFTVTGNSIRPFDATLSHQLYQDLFSAIEPQLAEVKHLVVVPGGALLSLPLGLLVRDPVAPNSEAYGSMAFLARDMAISTLPSLRAFTDLRGRVQRSKAPKPFLGFGNPGFTGRGDLANLAAHCRADRPTPPELIRGLAPLPDTAIEVRQVAQALGGGQSDIFLGHTVSESLVRRQNLLAYRVLYFATHGLLPGELACQSEPALALTPPSQPVNDFSQDGLLDASEIASLTLDADLVALSACNTGGGSGNFGGESLSGLARSFFYAGARSLLVSHWQVESRASRLLMVDMFQRYASGLSDKSAEALRQAQLTLLNNPATAHPFFWGAFTLVGDGHRS